MTARQSRLLSANFTAIAHATEDIGKVEQALGFVIALVARTEIALTRRYLKGHYGNVITTVSGRLSAKELSSESLSIISQKLPESDKQFLSDCAKSCLDEEGNLYLRFDKQEASLGNVKLYQGDPIRMKMKFAPGYDGEVIIGICKESGLIS
jgi:RNA binding exosome subunit